MTPVRPQGGTDSIRVVPCASAAEALIGHLFNRVTEPMTSEPSLPRVDVCAELYVDVWDLFGEQPFDPDDLSRRLAEYERDICLITGSDEPERHLDLLAAYGLLERNDDGRYWIRCPPDESVERWHQALRPQLETVHEWVHRLKRRRTDDPDSDENGTEDAIVARRNGKPYASIDLDEDATFRAIVPELTESIDRHPDVAGVTLRSPAALTGDVQQLADRLCSAETMAEIDCPRFEKVTSEVVGEHKNNLEYRLYLRPAW